MDAVRSDPLRPELHGEVPRERDDRALAGRVGVLRDRVPEQRRGGPDVHDSSSSAGDQVRDPVLADPEHPLQVDREHAIPDVLVGLEDGHVAIAPQDARVVVQDVERAESLDRALDRLAHLVLDRHVGHEGGDLAVDGADRRLRPCEQLRLDVDGRDPGALGREDRAGLPPHPAAGARDQRDLPIEPAPHGTTPYRELPLRSRPAS